MGQSMPENAITVLIVDDEPIVRMFAAEMVEEAGYAAIEAGDAHQALTVLDALDEVDVLFTDVDLPGDMTGLELAALVRRRWPAVKVIVTSGRNRPTALDLTAPGTFILKSYTREALDRALVNLH